jgi:hypothetical protein
MVNSQGVSYVRWKMQGSCPRPLPRPLPLEAEAEAEAKAEAMAKAVLAEAVRVEDLLILLGLENPRASPKKGADSGGCGLC